MAILVDIEIGVNVGNPILAFLLLALFIPIAVFITMWRQDGLLLKNSIVACTDAEEVNTYVRILYERLQSRQTVLESSIDGLISIHASSCVNVLCPCHEILAEQTAEDEDEEQSSEDTPVAAEPSLKPAAKDKVLSLKSKAIDKTQERFFEAESFAKSDLCNLYIKFIILEIEKWCRVHEDKSSLHMLLSYMKFFSFGNPLASLWEIMAAQDQAADIYEEFHIWRLL